MPRMQDPQAAARELERCVTQLGFHGFLVNGFSQVGDENTVVYYDDPRFADFWAVAAALKKPFYMASAFTSVRLAEEVRGCTPS